MVGRRELDISIAGSDTARELNLHKRVARVVELAGPLAGKLVLDCGCGAGGYAREYAKHGAKVVGVEYQHDKLETAPRNVPSVWLLAADAAALPLATGSVDVAVLNEVLEHVPDEQRVLSELHRVLVPGGKLILLSPNRLFPFESHGVTLRLGARKLPAHTPFVPYVPLALGVRVFDYWARNYWPWELPALVRGAGFRLCDTGYVAQTFENISGTQPRWLGAVKPALRRVVSVAERVPVVGAVCSVSQLVAAVKV